MIALKQYSIDYANHFPDGDGMKGLNKLQGEYITDYSTWLCPSAKTGAIHAKLADKDISYVYFGGYTDYSGDCWPAVYDYPLIFDRPGNHKDHINYANMYWCGTSKTKAKNCSEFIEELNKEKKYKPETLKKLREKAAEADRRYYSQKSIAFPITR